MEFIALNLRNRNRYTLYIFDIYFNVIKLPPKQEYDIRKKLMIVNIQVYITHECFRYHNKRMINYDVRRGVRVTTDAAGSTLTMANASGRDSGNYTCSPDNIRSSSVLVHVLSEGNSAEAVEQKAGVANGIGEKGHTPPSAAVYSHANRNGGLQIAILVLCFKGTFL